MRFLFIPSGYPHIQNLLNTIDFNIFSTSYNTITHTFIGIRYLSFREENYCV